MHCASPNSKPIPLADMASVPRPAAGSSKPTLWGFSAGAPESGARIRALCFRCVESRGMGCAAAEGLWLPWCGRRAVDIAGRGEEGVGVDRKGTFEGRLVRALIYLQAWSTALIEAAC